LGRAVGVKAGPKPVVWDATGGLGRDAFVLADLGCRVMLCERVSALAWLLEDAISAAKVSGHDQVREAAGRMTVHHGDSRHQEVPSAAVVYLDPMFPDRRQKAAAKKDLTLLQHLHGSAGGSTADDEAGALFDWAMSQQASRIVVKRGLKDAPLGGKPTFSLKGKAIRFDVYAR
jgi:16S rRNA (guanine1516-N2)-methyltransferase